MKLYYCDLTVEYDSVGNVAYTVVFSFPPIILQGINCTLINGQPASAEAALLMCIKARNEAMDILYELVSTEMKYQMEHLN